jgi:UDP-glucose 4-epimerase/UDP-glucuronate decarboxylase
MSQVGTRRILITGGAGFVGYHLTSELCKEATNEIVLVDNFARGRRDAELNALLAKPNVRIVSGDLARPEVYEQLGDGYDEVYHLAAVIGVKHVLERPEAVVRVNALSTILLLDWFTAGNNGKLLFSSTSEAYAWTQKFHQLPIPTPEDVPLALTDLSNPRSSYAGSKIFGELAVTQYGQRSGKPFVIVRYHNVYGPRMGHEHVIPELYARALRGESPLVVYSTHHRRAFCYVQDAVRCTIAAMRSSAANGKTFNIGNDREETLIGDLAKKILTRANRPQTITAKDAVNDPINRRCPDVSRARNVLGFEPQVSLDQGLDLTLAWYHRELTQQAASSKEGRHDRQVA